MSLILHATFQQCTSPLIRAHVDVSSTLRPGVGIFVLNDPRFRVRLTRTLVTIISRASLIAGDLLLVYATWANLYKRGTLRYTLAMNGFVAVLLRDGMCAVPEMATALLTTPVTGTIYFM